MQARKYSNHKLLISIAIYIGMSVLIFFVMPSGDDWGDVSKPLMRFLPGDLLPGYEPVHWRPLWVLYGYLLSFIPKIFPYLNHIIITICHFFNALIVFRLLSKFRIPNGTSIYIALFFLLSSASIAAIASVDGFIVLVTTLNLISFLLYLEFSGWKKYFYWLSITLISIAWNESGMVWLVLVPCLAFILKSSQNEVTFSKKIAGYYFRDILVGISVAIIYFLIRLYLTPGNSVGSEEGRYVLHFNPIIIVKNILLLTGLSLFPIDSIAFFANPRNVLLGLYTVLLSIPFLVLLTKQLFKVIATNKKDLIHVLLLIVAIIINMSPRIIIEQSAEMHAYPSLPLFALLIALLFKRLRKNKFIVLAIICYTVATICVNYHKLAKIYYTGKQAVGYGMYFKENTHGVPNNVLLLRIEKRVPDYSTYSVYQHEPRLSSAYIGGIMNFTYGYKDFNSREALTIMDLKCPSDLELDSLITRNLHLYDCIWTFETNGKMSVIQN